MTQRIRELKDLREMPDFNPSVPNGATSVSEGKVIWTEHNLVTCVKHGACLCVNEGRTLWRCPTCHEGAYVVWELRKEGRMDAEVAKMHRRIASSFVGVDKVAITVIQEQLGSISKCLDKIALSDDSRGYNAEIHGELADAAFHLSVFACRRGHSLSELVGMGEDRFRERHISEAEKETTQ